jgi:hypothetical protein
MLTGQLECCNTLYSRIRGPLPAVILIGLGLVIVGLGFKISRLHSIPGHLTSIRGPGGVWSGMAAVAKIAGFVASPGAHRAGAMEASWLPVGRNRLPFHAGRRDVGSGAACVRRMLAYSGGPRRIHHDRGGRGAFEGILFTSSSLAAAGWRPL